MSNTFIIIQARMTSQRLPGKVLLPIGNKPVLQVLVERLPSWRNRLIIATTNDGTEGPIIQLCKQLGLDYFRGDPENVLKRYYDAARARGAQDNDAIVRLTSDCPLIDNELTSRVIRTYHNNTVDMVSLGPHSGYPRGMDCSLFSFALLERTHLHAQHALDREHVTRAMPRFRERDSIHLHAETDCSHYRLTLDEADDYRAILAIYAHFDYQLGFSYGELISLLQMHPRLSDINRHVQQKPA